MAIGNLRVSWRPWRPVLFLGLMLLAATMSLTPGPCGADTAPLRAFCIDFNWGEGGPNGFAPPGLWAEASPQAHAAWYTALGCNVIQSFAVSCNGYAWYRSRLVPPQPGLAQDFLTELVRLGHARGLRVMGYFCVGANTRWGLEHPELSYGVPSAPHLPLTTAYLDFLAASIADALQSTGMDGFMIDWVWNPGDLEGQPLRWLPCEEALYGELFGQPFPGKEQVTPRRELEFRRRAIDRCWGRLRAVAKRVKPDCIIWLSCCNLRSPVLAQSPMLREVDWLMNEAPDFPTLAKLGANPASPRLLQCVVGWGDAHNARQLLRDAAKREVGIYGFAKPGPDSLPLPVSEFCRNPLASFQGNDRNLAVLARSWGAMEMPSLEFLWLPDEDLFAPSSLLQPR